MNDAPTFRLAGPLSRRPISRQEPLVDGRRYRVWLRIAAIAQGSVCVWVGGNRTDFFATAGDHIQHLLAGEGQDIVVQGLNAIATIEGLAVSEADD